MTCRYIVKYEIVNSTGIGYLFTASVKDSIFKLVARALCELFRSITKGPLNSQLTVIKKLSGVQVNIINLRSKWSGTNCRFMH